MATVKLVSMVSLFDIVTLMEAYCARLHVIVTVKGEFTCFRNHVKVVKLTFFEKIE